MNKLQEKILLYQEKMKEIEPHFDAALLEKITKSLGPAIYKKDSEVISCSNEKEREKIKKNFLRMKLGLDKSDEELENAIKDVCQKMASFNEKYRAIFYYFLIKRFNKDSLYI